MSSTFGGLTTAYSSLVAQRRALEVAGQNVANANTEGYTRQRVDLQAQGGPTVPAMWSTYDGAGGGVQVTGVVRVTDAFLTARQQLEHGKAAAQEQVSTNLTAVEDVLTEPSDSGIHQRLTDLASNFSDLANHPLDAGARQEVLQQAKQLADQIGIAGRDLDARWGSLRTGAGTMVEQANTYASQIGDLNAAIRRDVQGGTDANELMDQRDGLVLKLSDLLGATSRAGADGTVDVLVGGSSLVAGDRVTVLGLAGSGDPRRATTDPTRIVALPLGTAMEVSQGSLGGALDGLGRTYPGYTAQLDSFTAGLASTVNGILAGGRDQDGLPGQPLFTTNDGSSTITSRNITVAMTDPRRLAASATGGDAGGGNASAVARALQGDGGPASTYAALVSTLGVESQSAARRSSTQDDVKAKADDAVTSTAGVDTDEEMTNMLAYQRAYQAAARVMNTLDSTLDTLINKMGVG